MDQESNSITYFDCKKNAEVTLYLNDQGFVIACDLYYPDPQELQNFFNTDTITKTVQPPYSYPTIRRS